MSKKYFPLFLLVVFMALNSAAAPKIISEGIIVISGSLGMTFFGADFYLKADGTFVILSWTDVGPGAPGNQIHHGGGETGTYRYQASQDSDNVGSLSLIGYYGSPLTLTFDSNQTGSIINDFNGSQGHFYYSPRAEIAGASALSNRSWISPDHVSIAGFVVSGPGKRWVIIRGLGPALKTLGLSQVLEKLSIEIFSKGTSIGRNEGWSSVDYLVPGLSATFITAGMLPLSNGSGDCAMLIQLDPGAYTLHTSTTGAAGEALTEVYLLPYTEVHPTP